MRKEQKIVNNSSKELWILNEILYNFEDVRKMSDEVYEKYYDLRKCVESYVYAGEPKGENCDGTIHKSIITYKEVQNEKR